MRQNFLALLTSRYQQKPLTILWISMRIGGPPQKTKNPHHFNSERVLKLPEGSELHVLGALPGIEYSYEKTAKSKKYQQKYHHQARLSLVPFLKGIELATSEESLVQNIAMCEVPLVACLVRNF